MPRRQASQLVPNSWTGQREVAQTELVRSIPLEPCTSSRSVDAEDVSEVTEATVTEADDVVAARYPEHRLRVRLQ